jgi:hypothetical protein
VTSWRRLLEAARADFIRRSELEAQAAAEVYPAAG